MEETERIRLLEEFVAVAPKGMMANLVGSLRGDYVRFHGAEDGAHYALHLGLNGDLEDAMATIAILDELEAGGYYVALGADLEEAGSMKPIPGRYIASTGDYNMWSGTTRAEAVVRAAIAVWSREKA